MSIPTFKTRPYCELFSTARTSCLKSFAQAGLVVSSLLVANAAVADTCELGARYERLANKASAEFRRSDALEAMERAVEACGGSEYWQKLGALAASFGEADYNERAAEAFVNAHDMATDNPTRAIAAASYADLLFHTGDRSRAVDMIYKARNLDPNNSEILASAETMVAATRELTDEDVRRGVSDQMFKPLVLNRVDVAKPAGASAAGGSGSGASVAVAAAEEPEKQIRVQLQFQSGSTALDELSRSNLTTLVRNLVGLDRGKQFVFEGHADTRGDAAANRVLSTKRAEAVRSLVVGMDASLAGRIVVRGKGEDEPMSYGSLESDHQANRRLLVKYR